MISRILIALCTLSALTGALRAEPLKSGPQPGQRPGPYTAVVSTGKERGQSYCYICETEDRPAVVIFARSLTAPLAELAQKIDEALEKHQAKEMRAWITFLHADQSTFDPEVVQWAQNNAIRQLPLGIYEDVLGPISYRIHKDADVTVILFVKQKVAANFAFRAGDLNAKKVAEVMGALSQIVK